MKSVLLIALLLSIAADRLAAQYDARPLRSPLALEEHFQTNFGREGHRFEGYPINKFRLYNFYGRQAEYHLKGEATPELLLPYPGLQGGRQGHWGNTNEVLYSAVTDRTKEPEYHRLMVRSGGHFISFNPGEDRPRKALCILDGVGQTLSRVVLHAELYTPLHSFGYQIDRFGFNMTERGRQYFVNQGGEWFGISGAPAAVQTKGHHLYGENVFYRRTVAGGELFDLPQVYYDGELPIYGRVFEWAGAAPDLAFQLPEPAAEFKEEGAKLETSSRDGILSVMLKGSKFVVVHRVSGAEGVEVVQKDGRIRLNFPTAKKGDRWQITSWSSPVDGALTAAAPRKIPILSKALSGGNPYFNETVTVKGTLDADPAAKGSGYALDEIPVPVKNPYGVPMTNSGLAFDHGGAAYISTLHGDVWKVTGLDDSLENVVWKRFASGISMPLGLEMVDEVLHVLGYSGITVLHDYNQDGEADYHERFLLIGGLAPGTQNLERDAAGNFYVCGLGGMTRISPDGQKMETISVGARNPFGLGVRADGLALADSSEGSPNNGTCTIYEANHPENENSVSLNKRILYLPRGVDNSPGSRLFMDEPSFGPLGDGIVGTSFGSGRLYHILRDPNHGTPQAAMMLLPMEVSSGACRIALNPKDKHVYMVGLDGWGDFAVEEGSLNRIRYTEGPCLKPVEWKAYKNGIAVTFNTPLDPASAAKVKVFLQQWNYIDSPATYGSGEYSVKIPDQLGHDHLPVDSTHLSADGKELFIEAQGILPAMSTQIYARLEAANGAGLALNLFATLNQLNGDHAAAAAYQGDKPFDLVVPTKPTNGDTYSTITNFFDKRAGRDIAKRLVAAAVPYRAGELSYEWLNKNLIQKQCLPCHGPGTPHDYTSYEHFMRYVNLQAPGKSFMLGMMQSGSMPPYPMPAVAPEMQAALLQWIREGAKEVAIDYDKMVVVSQRKTATVSGEWIGREAELSRAHANDGNFATLWAAPDGARAGWVEIDLGEEMEVSQALLDDSPYSRTRQFELQVKSGDRWKPIHAGTMIGARHHITFDKLKGRVFRLDIQEAVDVPTVAEFQIFK